MDPKTLKDLDFQNKKVLMRVDFNVPLEGGKVVDDSKIRASLPSIEYILQNKGCLILMSHLGRPKGKVDPAFSLKPIAEKLGGLLHSPCPIAPDCVGKEVKAKLKKLFPGQVLLLENLRFHPGEENPEEDLQFSASLASLADIYVDDAFGAAHREHASTVAVARLFSQKAMGFLMEKEWRVFKELLEHSERPFYAIVGGAKVSSKIGVLKKLCEITDGLFLGGAMSLPFLKAEQKIDIASSPPPEKDLSLAKKNVHLPIDLVVRDSEEKTSPYQTVTLKKNTRIDRFCADVGEKTLEAWFLQLADAKTIFWNGPLGIFEIPPFDQGTKKMAEFLADLDAKTVIGGGDSLFAIKKLGLSEKFYHLSTGGGASLEFLEKGHLPGIDVLMEEKSS